MDTELNTLFKRMDLEPLNLELDKEVQSISKIMESINLIDTDIDEIREENLDKFLTDKYIPLEVNNLVCHSYFDDEDFVYLRLQLPAEILNHLIYYRQIDLIDYFSTILNNENKEQFANSEVYYNILAVYQYVLNYYQLPNSLKPIDKIKTFPTAYFKWVSNIINELRQQLNFTPDDQPTYYNMDKIDQELSYGMHIILSHLYIIIKYYHNAGMNIYQLSDKHIKRFVRLINNLSIIMIYFKFYSVDMSNKHREIPNFIENNGE